jgi:hypothetical protein
VRELLALAPIDAAAPESAFRIEDVGDPGAVARVVDVTRGDAAENRDKLTGLHVELYKFTIQLGAYHEKLFSIPGWQNIINLEGAGGELHGHLGYSSSEAGLFREYPDIAGIVVGTEKDKVFSIGRPLTAALCRRLVPSGQDIVETGAV